MGTITHLHIATCPEVSPVGRPCIELFGHARLGVTHMDRLGFEWEDQGIDSTYLSDPASEMAHAS